MRDALRWLIQALIASTVAPVALVFWCAYLVRVLL